LNVFLSNRNKSNLYKLLIFSLRIEHFSMAEAQRVATYTESQIEKLRELLVASQKALKLGNNYYDQAKQSYELCKKNGGKLDSQHATLELVGGELQKQIQLVVQLLNYLRARQTALVVSLLKLHNNDEETIRELSDILQKLQSKQVDAGIAEKKTLYDFVDTDSVNTLKTQASEEIRQVKLLQTNTESIVAQLDADYSKLLAMGSECTLSLTDYKSSYTSEKTNLQKHELDSMLSILNTMDAQYERVNHLYSTRDSHYTDLTAILLRTENELSIQISNLYDCLQRIQSIGKEVETRFQRHNSVFKNGLQLLQSLEKFGIDTKNKLTQLNALEIAFEERKEDSRFLFEEINNLVIWYELFVVAYDELVFEIGRRHEELRKQQEIVEIYQRELDLMWKIECQKRDHFLEFYGRYLPQSLCPAIMENAFRRVITPETVSTQLPVLVKNTERSSQSHIELALSRMNIADSDLPQDISKDVPNQYDTTTK